MSSPFCFLFSGPFQLGKHYYGADYMRHCGNSPGYRVGDVQAFESAEDSENRKYPKDSEGAGS